MLLSEMITIEARFVIVLYHSQNKNIKSCYRS